MELVVAQMQRRKLAERQEELFGQRGEGVMAQVQLAQLHDVPPVFGVNRSVPVQQLCGHLG